MNQGDLNQPKKINVKRKEKIHFRHYIIRLWWGGYISKYILKKMKNYSVEDFGLGEINSNVKLTSFRHKECSQSQERTMKIWAVQQKTL